VVLHHGALTRVRRRSRAALAAAALALAAGCATGGAPIAPTYTAEELKARCEMRGGIWRAEVIQGGYCEHNSQM
jgi:hypothetical protein